MVLLKVQAISILRRAVVLKGKVFPSLEFYQVHLPFL
jgi:hypothetical protein